MAKIFEEDEGGVGEREKVNEENTAIILILLRLNVMHFYREKKSFSIRNKRMKKMCIIKPKEEDRESLLGMSSSNIQYFSKKN